MLHVTESLLPPSETFVQSRLAGRRFEPRLVAWSRPTDGLPVPCPHRVVEPWSVPPAVGHRVGEPLGKILRHAHTLGFLYDERPTVVHAHFGTTALRIDRQCALLGIPLVVSFYGFDVGLVPRDAWGRRSYARLFRNASALTAEGPALARQLLALGAPPQKVKLLPLSLPSWALEHPRRAVAWDAPGLELFQVARFVEKKGLDTTLRAMAEARRRGADIRLTLAGDGPLRADLNALIDELKIGPFVKRPGFVRHGDLPDLFAHSHALVQPSRTASNGDTEGGHPTVLLEALAQGLPVLATRHADIPMVVEHGRSGLLVDEDDVDGLAGAMVLLFHARDELARLASQARARVLRRHDPERMTSLRERIYREALRTRAKKRRVKAFKPRSFR